MAVPGARLPRGPLPLGVAAYPDHPEAVLDVAGAFLASRPVAHNLVLTLLHNRVSTPGPGRYWVVSGEDGVPAGVVLQSPLDFPATLTPMPDAAVREAVDAIVADGVVLRGVNGEAATAARFAGLWTERTKLGAFPHDGQRIYSLDGPPLPVDPPPGRLRPAEPGDLPLLGDWMAGFDRDTGERTVGNFPMEARVAAGQVWLWDNGGAKSSAVHTEPVHGICRIQFVYTPPGERRRGYAGAAVGAISARLVAAGHRCILYTDLGNAVSNSVYRRLGYRAAVECLRYRFGEQP